MKYDFLMNKQTYKCFLTCKMGFLTQNNIRGDEYQLLLVAQEE